MRLILPSLLCVLSLASTLSSPAKIEDWKDPQGNTFKAEPSEALGPFALFRTPTGAGRRLPWRALSPADCVRFDEQVGPMTVAAAHWSDAGGKLTGRLRGYLREIAGVSPVQADLANRPEPQLLIVFFVDNSVSQSWDMLGKSIAPFKALLAKHPGEVAGVQFGANHGAQEHVDMAIKTNVPWLLVDYDEQKRITPLFLLSPRRTEFGLLMMSRDGVPISAANNPDAEAISRFFADAEVLLDLLHPGNPLSWADRVHYLKSVQVARHRQDNAGPLLVGDPLVPKGLKDRGIFRVEAKIEVGADGKVTGVTLKDDASIPAAMAPALAKALQRSSVFVPAVDHGQFVAGTYDYVVDVPR